MIHLYHSTVGGADKIWGWLKVDSGAMTFWGKARGTLAFKAWSSPYTLNRLAYAKEDKGYRPVENDAANRVLPPDFEGQLLLAKLGQTKF